MSSRELVFLKKTKEFQKGEKTMEKTVVESYNMEPSKRTRRRKDLAELKRMFQNIMQEVTLLSERQEVLKDMVEDTIKLQNGATENYYEQIFKEMMEKIQNE